MPTIRRHTPAASLPSEFSGAALRSGDPDNDRCGGICTFRRNIFDQHAALAGGGFRQIWQAVLLAYSLCSGPFF